jgi:hypothetical protein
MGELYAYVAPVLALGSAGVPSPRRIIALGRTTGGSTSDGVSAAGDHTQSTWAFVEHAVRELPHVGRLAPDSGGAGNGSQQNQLPFARHARKSEMRAVPLQTGIHECGKALRGLSREHSSESDGAELRTVPRGEGLEYCCPTGARSPEPPPIDGRARRCAVRRMPHAGSHGTIPRTSHRMQFLPFERLAEHHESAACQRRARVCAGQLPGVSQF